MNWIHFMQTKALIIFIIWNTQKLVQWMFGSINWMRDPPRICGQIAEGETLAESEIGGCVEFDYDPELQKKMRPVLEVI